MAESVFDEVLNWMMNKGRRFRSWFVPFMKCNVEPQPSTACTATTKCDVDLAGIDHFRCGGRVPLLSALT